MELKEFNTEHLKGLISEPEEFDLSEHEIDIDLGQTAYLTKNIKEFIRLLKEYPDDSRSDYVIDKLAGEKFK